MKKLLINGEWVETQKSSPNINPSDISDVIAEHAVADQNAIRSAVTAARDAFPVWSNKTIQERSDALDAIGSELLLRRQELGDLLAREEGKTLAEAIGEVIRAGQIFKYFAGEALRIKGEIIDSVRPQVDVSTVREPLGVVALITPWNFPIAIPAWKTAPALAAGNTVVLKPAEQAPGCAWALAEIIARSDLPKGAFNLVTGGVEAGKALAQHNEIDAVSFTGSVIAGNSVHAAAAKQGIPVQLEMGGKNPLIILDDAALDTAIECAVQGSYYSTGQRCTASSRLIVHKNIHEEFVARMTARLNSLVVGDARKTETNIGPVIDQGQLDKNLHYIHKGKSEGAELMTGGETLERSTKGFYFSPALFVNANETMTIAKEEIFGPIACVIRADDYDHALQIANNTEFGLSAGICTNSLKHARHFRRHSQAGLVMVNLPTAGIDYHVPFGGHKNSSFGAREQGAQALEFFSHGKTIYSAV